LVLFCAAFPTALNECFDVYKWVAEGKLGMRPSKCVKAALFGSALLPCLPPSFFGGAASVGL
jgi:hypothetical protein